MVNVITWCNNNSGFIQAFLSLMTVIVSFVAIFVSIRTARLPFVKKLKLSQSIDYRVSNGNIEGKLFALSQQVVNVGNREVFITYLGLAVKDDNKRMVKIVNLEGDIFSGKALKPSEMISFSYDAAWMMMAISHGKYQRNQFYIWAEDSEGKTYKKRWLKGKQILDL